MIRVLDWIIYWSLVLIPFFCGVAPAPMFIFIGLACAAFLAKRAIQRRLPWEKSPVNLPLLCFLAIACVSIIHSIDLKDSIRGGMGRLLYSVIMMYALQGEIRDKRHFNAILCSIGAGIALMSLDAFWQVFSGKDFIRGYEPVVNFGFIRATAAFKDSNLLGIYLSCLVPLMAGFAWLYHKGWKKAPAAAVSLLGLSSIALTYSRPTLLAAYLSLVAFALIGKRRVALWVLVACALASPLLAPKGVKEWARKVDYNPVRFMCNDDRIAMYRNTLNMVRSHPVIGVGVNTYMKNYRLYKENPEYRGMVTTDYAYAHNNFLHMAGEVGIPGLAIFLWFLAALFISLAQLARQAKDRYYFILSVSLAICLAAFLVNGLTESSLFYPRVALLFWYLAGMGLSLKRFISP